MGAVLEPNGCTFRVWAPNATGVFLVGDFTTPPWTQRLELLPGGSDPHGGCRSVSVDGVGDGAKYRYVVRRGAAEEERLDPRSREAAREPGQELRHSVVRRDVFEWEATSFRMPAWNDLVIYEFHVGTFNDEIDGPEGTFDELVEELVYLRDLGVSAVELMPVSEFPSATSMGYNPSLPFAVENAYGTAADFKEFVRRAHGNDLAVLVDVVYNHFGPDLGESLWRFDLWPDEQHRGGIYFYNDDRVITDFGDRPDFGRPEVRQYIRDNTMMWLSEYRVDGLRVDSTLNIHRAVGKGVDRGPIAEGWQLLQWINRDKDADGAWKINIAEDLQDNPAITRAIPAGGAGFNAQWDKRFHDTMRDTLVPADDGARQMWRVRDAIYHRYDGDAFRRVIYTESHDEVTIQNGDDLGRMTRKVNWHDAEGYDARKRSTLGAALVFTAPGIPMLFQGQELLEWRTWTDQTPMDWAREHRFGGILNLYRDLIKLRRNRRGNTRGLQGRHVNVFHENEGAKVIAFHRWMDGGAGDDVVVVANFSGREYPGYNVGFPRAGTWWLRFNSDWRGYAGDYGNVGYDTTAGCGPNQGMPFNGNVGLGRYSAIVLSQ